MIKFLLLILFSVTAWGQSTAPVVYVSPEGTYIHPIPVLYAQAFNRYLVVKIENNQLTITNPNGVSYSDVQIIQANGEQINLIVQYANADELNRTRKLKSQKNDLSNMKTKILYSKKYTNTHTYGKNLDRRFIRDTNQFNFQTKLSKDLSFSAFFYDISTEAGEYERYNRRYLLGLRYKEFFADYGTMGLYKRVNRNINNSSAIFGTRIGYMSQRNYFDLVEGRGFVGNEAEGDRVYGGSYIHNWLGNSIGLYYHQTAEGESKTPTIDWVIPFLKKWEFSGAATQNIAPGLESNNSTMNLRFIDTVKDFGITSFFVNHYYRPEGQVNLVFGNLTNQQFERFSTGTSLQLFKRKNEDSLNTNFSFGRFIGEYSLQDTYSVGTFYRFKKLDLGINYNLRTQWDTISNTTESFYSYNPYMSWRHQHKNNRVSRVNVSTRLASGRDAVSNSYRMTYQNSSQLNSHTVSLARNIVDIETGIFAENPNADAYSAAYNYGQTLSDNWRINLGANTNISNTKKVDRENYYLDNYSYYVGTLFDIKRIHSFSIRYARSVNTRSEISDIKADSFFLGYSFRFGTNSQNPLQYLFNNKSIKAHFYYDQNFNGKMDNGEKLIANMPIEIYDPKDVMETKNTDKDGYVRFSGLEPAGFKISIPTSFGTIVANDHKFIDLSKGSFSGEIGVAKLRNVSVKIYDETIKGYIKSSMSFELSCPDIGYSSTQTFNFGHSSVFTIPDVPNCSIVPIPINFVNNFEAIDMRMRTITSSDVVFKIRQKRVMDVILNQEPGNIPFNIIIDGVNHKVNNITSIPVKNLLYDLNSSIKPPKGVVCFPEKPIISFHPDFYEKKQVTISCRKK